MRYRQVQGFGRVHRRDRAIAPGQVACRRVLQKAVVRLAHCCTANYRPRLHLPSVAAGVGAAQDQHLKLASGNLGAQASIQAWAWALELGLVYELVQIQVAIVAHAY